MKTLLLALCLTVGLAHAAEPLRAPTPQTLPKRDIGCPTGTHPSSTQFCTANSPRDYFVPEAPDRTCPTGFVRAGSGYCRATAR